MNDILQYAENTYHLQLLALFYTYSYKFLKLKIFLKIPWSWFFHIHIVKNAGKSIIFIYGNLKSARLRFKYISNDLSKNYINLPFILFLLVIWILKMAVLGSTRGTDLQAVIGVIESKQLKDVEISFVLSNNPNLTVC